MARSYEGHDWEVSQDQGADGLGVLCYEATGPPNSTCGGRFCRTFIPGRGGTRRNGGGYLYRIDAIYRTQPSPEQRASRFLVQASYGPTRA